MKASLCICILGLWAALPGRAQLTWPNSQDYLARDRIATNVKFTGLTYHPGGGENAEPYKRSLDSKDYWVLQVGLEGNADYLLHRFLYLRAATSLYRDCADVWAGFFHFGFRANWDVVPRFSMRVGVGPTFLWRETWLGVVKDYTKDSFFGKAGDEDYQSAFIWHGGDVELEWKAARRLSLVYSVIPGYPEVINSSFGFRLNF